MNGVKMIMVPAEDIVNHPSHYTDGKIEVIDFIEDKQLNFNLGNVVKYVSRAGRKKSKGKSMEDKALEDLKKARFYIEREIEARECARLYKLHAKGEFPTDETN